MTKPQTREIPLSLLRRAIKTIKGAIPRSSDGYCVVCGSEPFQSCYGDCDAKNARDLLYELRGVAKRKTDAD